MILKAKTAIEYKKSLKKSTPHSDVHRLVQFYYVT